jgi:hypothetical protein
VALINLKGGEQIMNRQALGEYHSAHNPFPIIKGGEQTKNSLAGMIAVLGLLPIINAVYGLISPPPHYSGQLGHGPASHTNNRAYDRNPLASHTSCNNWLFSGWFDNSPLSSVSLLARPAPQALLPMREMNLIYRVELKECQGIL